jgi:hypothetical protein
MGKKSYCKIEVNDPCICATIAGASLGVGAIMPLLQ